MTTKVKGLLKGLRYISRVFDDGKEREMEIGFPTDVKHVAHIGCDGPAVNESPSWMKDFEASPGGGIPSGQLSVGDNKEENSEAKLVSEDSSQRASRPLESPGKDLPKSSRRSTSTESSSGSGSLRKEKSRHARRHHSKDSGEIAKPNKQVQLQEGGGGGPHSPSTSLPDVPKKSRRKKSKEYEGEGSSRLSRKGKNSQNSDIGPDPESSIRSNNSELSQTG